MVYQDAFGGAGIDPSALSARTRSGEGAGLRMVGESVDRVWKRGELVREVRGHNLVVDSCMVLVMSLFKGEEGFEGLQYWAVGSGDPAWDSEPVEPTAADVKLQHELGRLKLEPECFKFLQAGSYEESEAGTNILQVTKVFEEGDCNGEWREFGIFGGNATEAADSGVMVNRRRHAIITKTEEMRVERIMRFTLTLV